MARLSAVLLLALASLLAACSQNEAPAAKLNVLEVFPADGATGVPVDTVVTVEFDAAVSEVSLAGAFALSSGGTPVAGTLLVDVEAATLVFTPAAALDPASEYVASLEGTVTGLHGASLSGGMTWAFTTESLPEEEPAGPRTGDEEPTDPGTGDEEPTDPGSDDEEPTDPDEGGEPVDSDGDGIPDELDGEPEDPDADGDGILDGELIDHLDGIAAIEPGPETKTSNRWSLSVTLDRAIDPATLDDDTITVHTLPDGNHRIAGERHGAPLAGVLTYDPETFTLTFTFDEELKTAPPKYWVFLELDVLDDDGEPFQVSARWRYHVH